jgi:hypothetical protein
MVALQNEGAALAKEIPDVLSHAAGVREHAKTASGAFEDKLTRLAGIMGDRKRQDAQVANAETRLMAREET